MSRKSTLILYLTITMLLMLAWKYFSLSGQERHATLSDAQHCDVGLFMKKIDNVILQIVDLTAPDELFLNKDFIQVYEDPELYYPCAIESLQDDDIDVLHKTVIVFSMKRIKTEYYVEMVRVCYHELLKKRINEDLLSEAMLSPFGKSHPFIHSYDDRHTVSLIDSMMADNDLSDDFKETLRKIKSGQLSKELAGIDKYH